MITYADIPNNLYKQLSSIIQPGKVLVLYKNESQGDILENWTVISSADNSKVLDIIFDSYLDWNVNRIYWQTIHCDIAGHSEYKVSAVNHSTKENTQPNMAAACPNLYKLYKQVRVLCK